MADTKLIQDATPAECWFYLFGDESPRNWLARERVGKESDRNTVVAFVSKLPYVTRDRRILADKLGRHIRSVVPTADAVIPSPR